MNVKKIAQAALMVTATSSLVVACSSDGGGSSASSEGSSGGDNYVIAWGSEPQNPLIPANTNEVGGGKLVETLFAGLVHYDAEGKTHNDVAKSIEKTGDTTYTVTLNQDRKFSDGSAVKAHNFVDAWNLAVAKDMRNSYFFEPIKGYAAGVEKLEGLKVVDDYTFTIELSQPEADFPVRLGYSAFYPLPDVAFNDLDAFGENPVGNGPYKLQSWEHNQAATIVPNPEYVGDLKPQNDGVQFTFTAKLDAAYADLVAGNLDVLDAIPDSALTTYESDLSGRSVNTPVAVFQSFTIPNWLPHFSGAEGNLRRQAISMSVDRNQIVDKIFAGTKSPAKEFTSPVIDGYTDHIPGADVLTYNPEKAKELWAQADAISPFTGSFELAYNADGGHEGWVDAVTNSIRNTLGIEALGKPYPDFKSFRDDIVNEKITSAFRSGWQGDYPGLGNFLVPLYATGGSSNDGKYSNPEFDKLMKQAAGAASVEESNKLYNQAQEILMKELPAVPIWYSTVTAGWSDKVDNVQFSWNSTPLYYQITKK